MSIHQPPSPYAPPVFPVGMPPLATTGQRFLARLIDTVVLGVVWTLMLSATGALEYTLENPGEYDLPKVLVSVVLTFTLYFAYEGAMLARSGQTLGKKALRVRVAMLADGNIPGRHGWTRAAVYALPGILYPLLVGTVFWVVNSVWQLRDRPYRQCLHDKAAKTVVVSAW
ncbi:RDD family protein [Streptomyces sp. LX-29]|uniref:RDD family protein n=1 Tax=Streptomyces sp. LX-29 TaxID=2900152 RepID=UPI00240E4247|nr:RDD family protein [Streptomyces sp. LX-29]WFB09253.1 RDD family protein [Streptomyces sp. LX-29]